MTDKVIFPFVGKEISPAASELRFELMEFCGGFKQCKYYYPVTYMLADQEETLEHLCTYESNDVTPSAVHNHHKNYDLSACPYQNEYHTWRLLKK